VLFLQLRARIKLTVSRLVAPTNHQHNRTREDCGLSRKLSEPVTAYAGPLSIISPRQCGGGRTDCSPAWGRLVQSWLGLAFMATVFWQLYLLVLLPQAHWKSTPLPLSPALGQGVWWIDLPCMGLVLFCVQTVFFLPGFPLIRLVGVVLSLLMLHSVPIATGRIGEAFWQTDYAGASINFSTWLSPFSAVLLTGGVSSIALRRAGRWTMKAGGPDVDSSELAGSHVIPPTFSVRDGLEWMTVAAFGFTGFRCFYHGRLPVAEDFHFAVLSLVCVVRLITLSPDLCCRRLGRMIGLFSIVVVFAWIIASHTDQTVSNGAHALRVVGSACASGVIYWFVTKVPILWLQLNGWQWTRSNAPATNSPRNSPGLVGGATISQTTDHTTSTHAEFPVRPIESAEDIDRPAWPEASNGPAAIG